jgi:hypothetical protein
VDSLCGNGMIIGVCGRPGLRLISINLQKRLNDPHSHRALVRWLSPLNANIVAVQEPVAAGKEIPEELGGLYRAGGDENVACWIAFSEGNATEVLPIPAIIVELASVVVCNIYLSAYSSATRIRQLQELRPRLFHYQKPVIIVGDFNLAPLPMDGLYGDTASAWTTQKERLALTEMTNELDLVDLTSPFLLGKQHFTFERINRGKWTRFRCDLAFAQASSKWSAYYDHSVRRGPYAFTDHSACIIDGDGEVRLTDPISLSNTGGEAVALVRAVRPENTAMKRTGPSKPIKALVASGFLSQWNVRSILDYGCGHGSDVNHLSSLWPWF